MKYAIPSALLISLMALSACGAPSQRYGANGSSGYQANTTSPAMTGTQNVPETRGNVGAGMSGPDGGKPAN